MTGTTTPAPQPALDVPGHLPHAMRATGHLEVLDIRRRSRKHPELLLFKGHPGSKLSQVKSLLVNIGQDSGGLAPAPWLEREKNRIHLFFPSMDHPELQALVTAPGAFVCYFWSSPDGSKTLAWLLKAH